MKTAMEQFSQLYIWHMKNVTENQEFRSSSQTHEEKLLSAYF